MALWAALLALVSWQVVARGPLYRWDTGLDSTVLRAAGRDGAVRPLAQLLADLGNTGVAIPVLAVVLGLVAWRYHRTGVRRWWLPSLVGAVVMAGAAPLVVLLKALVARPAPGSTVLAAHSGYYPSGHAATAAMAYGLVVLLALPFLRRTAARRLVVTAAVLLNITVGAALVWRGYHWPLDVAASWCLSGVLLTLTGPVLMRWWGSPG